MFTTTTTTTTTTTKSIMLGQFAKSILFVFYLNKFKFHVDLTIFKKLALGKTNCNSEQFNLEKKKKKIASSSFFKVLVIDVISYVFPGKQFIP